MKINWKVRIKNPVFWGAGSGSGCGADSGLPGSFLGRYDHLGGLWEVFVKAISNPVVIVSVLVSVWNLYHRPDHQRSWGQQTGIELPEAKRGVIHGDYQEYWRDCGHGAFLLTHYLAL